MVVPGFGKNLCGEQLLEDPLRLPTVQDVLKRLEALRRHPSLGGKRCDAWNERDGLDPELRLRGRLVERLAPRERLADDHLGAVVQGNRRKQVAVSAESE